MSNFIIKRCEPCDSEIAHLTCETDSVTICPPATGIFDVNVVNQIETEDRFLDCETDSITICPPTTGVFDVNVINQSEDRFLDCETDSITICPPATGIFDVQIVDQPIAVTGPITDAELRATLVETGTDIRRPSETPGRTHVNEVAENVSANTVVHTVTAGTRFFLTSIIISAANSSTLAAGRLALRDGGIAGDMKMVYRAPIAPAIGETGPLVDSTTFAEPIRFDTNVFGHLLGGSLTYSLVIVGYEEVL